jgi:hypothetical protein
VGADVGESGPCGGRLGGSGNDVNGGDGESGVCPLLFKFSVFSFYSSLSYSCFVFRTNNWNGKDLKLKQLKFLH